MKQEVVRIFDDLEALHNFCRIELKPFSPTDLYNKESQIWRDFEYSKRPKKQWNGERKPYQGNKPRHNGSFNNKPRFKD